MVKCKRGSDYLESSRSPETSHGFQDCFPQSPRQSTGGSSSKGPKTSKHSKKHSHLFALCVKQRFRNYPVVRVCCDTVCITTVVMHEFNSANPYEMPIINVKTTQLEADYIQKRLSHSQKQHNANSIYSFEPSLKILLYASVLDCDHRGDSERRIRWTSGRPMYTDSAMVSWRLRGVGVQ